MTTIVGNNKYSVKKYLFVKELNINIPSTLIYGYLRTKILHKDKDALIPKDICNIIQKFYAKT